MIFRKKFLTRFFCLRLKRAKERIRKTSGHLKRPIKVWIHGRKRRKNLGRKLQQPKEYSLHPQPEPLLKRRWITSTRTSMAFGRIRLPRRKGSDKLPKISPQHGGGALYLNNSSISQTYLKQYT